ncbi:hypothetical protein M0R45_008553 [Rubus argutus]|uniref:Uncharacterized protein n=1 Tax=Rubus argutus TaxID=59490 RepID=A0AAW1Y3D4_RUBAR
MAALPHKPPSLQPNHSAHGLTSSNPNSHTIPTQNPHAAVNPPLPSTPASSSSSLPSRASNRRCYHQQSAAAFNLSPSRLRRVRFLLRPVLKPASAQPLFLSPPPIIKAPVRTALAIDLPSSLQNLTTPSSPKSIKAAPP